VVEVANALLRQFLWGEHVGGVWTPRAPSAMRKIQRRLSKKAMHHPKGVSAAR